MTDTVVVAVVAAVASLVSSVLSFYARREAKGARTHAEQANHAVNGVPSGEPRLYPMVKELYMDSLDARMWRDGFRGTPFESGQTARAWVEEERVWRVKCEEKMR